MPSQQSSIARAAVIAGVIAIAACSSPTVTTGAGGKLASDNKPIGQQELAARADAEKARCFARADAVHPEAERYYQTVVIRGTGDGYFNKKYAKDYLQSVDEYRKCQIDFQKNLVGVIDPEFIEIARASTLISVQRERDLANGRLSFSQFRRAVIAQVSNRDQQIAARKATLEADTRQKEEAQATEEAQQAEADAEEQARTTANNTAMMGAMMGMMNQPTYTPRGRAPSYVAPTPSYMAPTAMPSQSAPSRSTYRDATSCARMSRAVSPNQVALSNSCSGKITIWMGGEFRILEAGASANYTTIARQITYACFNAPGEQLCER